MSLSDKDYQKKLDVQIAYWDKLKNEIQKVRSGENGTADLVDMSETYFQMADETVAAVKVSHANRQLVKMTDRYVLEVGNVAMENTAANLLADASVREAYLGG